LRGDTWKLYALVAVACVALLWSFGHYQYNAGWNEGRAKLVAQQEDKARATLAKRVTVQQVNDTKAAEAEQAGAAKTVVITREVVKYVQNPDRVRCTFDDDRVRIKQRAIDNANAIPGYDGEAVPVSGGGKGQ
jgi:hypothetical protein